MLYEDAQRRKAKQEYANEEKAQQEVTSMGTVV